MTFLFDLLLCCYAAGLLLAVINLFSRRQYLDAAVNVLLGAANAMQFGYIVWRWIEAGRPPFSNMFESLFLFAWATAFIYLVLRLRLRIPFLSAAVALMVTVILVYASSYESHIEPLVPALRSNWLTFHVLTCFLGYSGFAISFIAAVAYLVVIRRPGPSAEQSGFMLENAMSRTAAFGFIFLTIGIISGSVWANSAWGTYWSWDPKETWSLITWFIYAAFLHCRYMRGWSGRRAAWISIVGFLSVLFTYIGVNFLLSGLHSYAK